MHRFVGVILSVFPRWGVLEDVTARKRVYVLLSAWCRVCAAEDEETAGARAEQQPVALLAGVSMAMVILVAAGSVSVYLYNHPTSSVSLFFMEVSVQVIFA